MTAIEPWRKHLVETREGIQRLLENTHRIAVIGVKPDPIQPAHFVPEYAQRAGYEVVPVPVYYPEMTEFLGQPVYRSLADIPGDIDMVNIFRRPAQVAEHVDDILAKRPRSVWLQLGIRNDEVAEQLAREGIDVVQNHCLMVEMRRAGR
jgi:uncharacterized protein